MSKGLPSSLFGKPAWLEEALENDKKPEKEEKFEGLTVAALPWRATYEDFWDDHYHLLPGAERSPRPADLKEGVKQILEHLHKEHPKDIDISGIEYGATKVFMKREVYAEIGLLRRQ